MRALVARAAHLSDKESENLETAWRLRRATFHGPIATRDETR